MIKNIAIGSDHAGYEMKTKLITWLERKDITVNDCGTNSTESVDYPDYAHAVAKAVEEGQSEVGVLLCGSGNGVCMTANKHKDIRAGLAWDKEVAALIKQHNNANIICIPARFLSYRKITRILNTYLETEFEGGRHQRRIDKM